MDLGNSVCCSSCFSACYCILHVILSHLLHSTCQIPPSWPSSSLGLLSGDFDFHATKELTYEASRSNSTFQFWLFPTIFFDEMNFLLCMTIFHEPPFFNRCFMYVWAMNFSFLENSMLDRTPPSFVIFYFEGATVRLTRRRQYHQPHISVPCLTFHSTLPLGGLFFFHLLRSNGAFIHFWNSFTKGYYVLLKIGGACDFLGCSKNP